MGLVQSGHFPAERRPLQLQNAQQALRCFGQLDADSVRGCKPEALVDGDRPASLASLWTIFLHFQACMPPLYVVSSIHGVADMPFNPHMWFWLSNLICSKTSGRVISFYMCPAAPTAARLPCTVRGDTAHTNLEGQTQQGSRIAPAVAESERPEAQVGGRGGRADSGAAAEVGRRHLQPQQCSRPRHERRNFC